MAEPPPQVEPFRLLFVCTGNTCRSPLAEAIARRKVEERDWEHVEVGSAGVGAFDGAPASGGSLRVASANGLDLGGHGSRLLTPELVGWADLVLTMSFGHLVRVFELGGGEHAAVITDFAAGTETEGGGTGGVPDPIGGPDEDYVVTYQVLDALIEQTLHRLEAVLSP